MNLLCVIQLPSQFNERLIKCSDEQVYLSRGMLVLQFLKSTYSDSPKESVN